MGTIFTFYSYKGGVGRTHLLANLAAYLCYYRKRKVLMIDWDLEAPGLHYYYGKTNQTIESKGLIDLFNDHNQKVQGIETETFNEKDFIVPDENYITPLIQAENGGTIDLMPAIDYREDGYHGKVDAFDWSEFYDKFSGGNYLLWFKDQLKRKYDYVLIDSRTGFNDYSGICNVLMPDMNIILMAPNQQNFDGAKQMANRIINAKYTKEEKRKPFILPVLSKIDVSYGKVGDQWKKRFAREFAFTMSLFDEDLNIFDKDILEIISAQTVLTYNADFALGEPIHFDKEAKRLGEGSYLKHFENIALDFLEEMYEKGEVSINKIFAYALLGFLKENIDENPDDYDSWVSLGQIYSELGKNREAMSAYENALNIKADDEKILHNLGIIYYYQERYEMSIRAFKKAVKIKPDYDKAWNNLGFVYLTKGDLNEAKDAFNKALNLTNKQHDMSLMNMGHLALIDKNEGNAIDLYQKSLNNFEDKTQFFTKMEDAFPHLEKQNISRQTFDQIIKKLKVYQTKTKKE